MLRTDPGAADALLVDLRTQIQQAVADIRRIVHDLRPPVLDDRGLIAALQESAARFGTATMQVSVTAQQPLPDLPAAVEVAAYRIAGEAMTNAARHAAASRCEVALRIVDGTLCVEVTDDGRGLPAEPAGGVGLASIRERAAELGGSSSVGPAPGGGVRVSASLPLQETR